MKKSKKFRSVNSEFRLRVKLESKICYSDPFKLYSSCSQLPSDVRMDVRPTKKVTPRKRRKDDSETDSDKVMRFFSCYIVRRLHLLF